MHEALFVHKLQRPQNRRKHPSRLLCRQSALRKNLREILFRVLHHDIKQICAIQFAASSFENTNQIRMAPFAGRLPSEELMVRVRRASGNQFDGRDLLYIVMEYAEE